jgi:hypothetical protein
METRDPLAGSPWSTPSTVAGFVQSPPNEALLHAAAGEWRDGARLLDIGCGAGRNAVPAGACGMGRLRSGSVVAHGHDSRVAVARPSCTDRARVLLAPMDRLPFASSVVRLHRRAWHLEPGAVGRRVPPARGRGGSCGAAGMRLVSLHVLASHAASGGGACAPASPSCSRSFPVSRSAF